MTNRFERLNRYISIYMSLFIGYLLLTRVVYFTYYFGENLNTLIATLFSIVGVILLSVKVFINYKVFINKFSILLLVFIIISIISSIINVEYGYLSNVKMIIWMNIQFFLGFSLVTDSNESIKKLMKRIGLFVISIMFICSIVSIVYYLLNVKFYISLPDYPRVQGFSDGRLYGIFDDPNYAAMASIASIQFSVLYVDGAKVKVIKIFNLANIFIQLIFILLTNSRTGLIALILCIVFFSYYLANHLFFSKRYLFKRCITCFICSTIVLLSVIIGMRNLIASLPTLIHEKEPVLEEIIDSNISQNESIQTPEMATENAKRDDSTVEKGEDITKNQTLDRQDVEKDYTNNRIDIWKNALYISKDNRIFGLSPRNILSYARANYPYDYTAQTGYETHNGYLSVLVCGGVSSCLIIGIFISFCIKSILKKLTNKLNLYDLACIMITTCYAMSAFTLQDVFYMNNMTTVLFWVALGVCIFKENDIKVVE